MPRARKSQRWDFSVFRAEGYPQSPAGFNRVFEVTAIPPHSGKRIEIILAIDSRQLNSCPAVIRHGGQSVIRVN